MTIEQILGLTADELEKLSDDQLREYFKPYLDYTIPSSDKDDESSSPAPSRKPVSTLSKDEKLRISIEAAKKAKQDKAKELMEKFGIDINNL